MIIAFWKKAVDPSIAQIKIEIFYGIWIFLIEAAWIIYGNTFIYSEQIKDCDESFNITFTKVATGCFFLTES